MQKNKQHEVIRTEPVHVNKVRGWLYAERWSLARHRWIFIGRRRTVAQVVVAVEENARKRMAAYGWLELLQELEWDAAAGQVYTADELAAVASAPARLHYIRKAGGK